jgi:hypothetical protein
VRALRLGHDKKFMNIATLFGYLEEADITRQLEDAEWSDAAFALYRNDDRAVQLLIDLVHRGSGREHPRIMLADFLSIKGHVCEVAKRALSAVQVRPSTGPAALPLDGEMSWCETKEVLGLASDGELHAIWKICLERGVTGKRRHAFTRESVNALLWRLSGAASTPYDSNGRSELVRATSSGLARPVLHALRDTALQPRFDFSYGISTLRLIDPASSNGVASAVSIYPAKDMV